MNSNLQTKKFQDLQVETDVSEIAYLYAEDSETNMCKSTIESIREYVMESCNEAIKASEEKLQAAINAVYPVGAIYMSVNSTNPSTLFGGTWSQIQDRFLLAAGGTYAAGSTGGSANAIIPKHSHTVTGTAASAGSHTHVSGYRRKDVYGGGSYDAMHWTNYDDGSVSTSSNGAHTHSVSGTAASTGVDVAGKNMPPYLTVYVWKRTA